MLSRHSIGSDVCGYTDVHLVEDAETLWLQFYEDPVRTAHACARHIPLPIFFYRMRSNRTLALALFEVKQHWTIDERVHTLLGFIYAPSVMDTLLTHFPHIWTCLHEDEFMAAYIWQTSLTEYTELRQTLVRNGAELDRFLPQEYYNHQHECILFDALRVEDLAWVRNIARSVSARALARMRNRWGDTPLQAFLHQEAFDPSKYRACFQIVLFIEQHSEAQWVLADVYDACRIMLTDNVKCECVMSFLHTVAFEYMQDMLRIPFYEFPLLHLLVAVDAVSDEFLIHCAMQVSDTRDRFGDTFTSWCAYRRRWRVLKHILPHRLRELHVVDNTGKLPVHWIIELNCTYYETPLVRELVAQWFIPHLPLESWFDQDTRSLVHCSQRWTEFLAEWDIRDRSVYSYRRRRAMSASGIPFSIQQYV